MSDGDADQARSWISRARMAGPTENEAAALDLLEADAWLVTKEPETAVAAYRRVASRWAGTSEAETAAFAVGQLLVEGGSPAAAETALDEYLARYPHGRFVREAREQLALVRASP
jgi:outer membrane protein assembly factor BamD (BamD/ComL family)